MSTLFGEQLWRGRGEHEQTQRLNADFSNGMSSGPSFETDVVQIPLTPNGPAAVVIPLSPRSQRLGYARRWAVCGHLPAGGGGGGGAS